MGKVFLAKVGVSFVPKGEKNEQYFEAGSLLRDLTPKTIKGLQALDAISEVEESGGTE